MPSWFRDLDDRALLDFASELCDEHTISSFARRIYHARGLEFELQELLSWHYIELIVMLMLRRNEVLRIFNRPMSEEIQNGWYETKEFLSISLNVYRAMDESSRRKFRSRFCGMFNDSQGLIPLAHEMLTAYTLAQEGHKVEFVELAGEGDYNLRATKADVSVQIDCKSIGELGLFFTPQRAAVVLKEYTKLLKLDDGLLKTK